MQRFAKLLLIGGLVVITSCSDDVNNMEWNVKAKGAVISHPVQSGNTIFFGSTDNSFYAIDLNSQVPSWVFPTNSPIQSKPLVYGDYVYFFNAKSVFALHAQTGEELWRHPYSNAENGGSIDPWDYHHGAPIAIDSLIYFGLADGNLYGFKPLTGEIMDQFTAIDSAVIRCTPIQEDKILYFGDWNGIVYSYDTELQDTIWTYKTYAEKQYDTFGQLNTEFIVFDSLLIFGGRNPELQILNKTTGRRVWSYVSVDGGWISGDPIVMGDTLFIAGSDNHKFFAFDVASGEIFWEFEFLFNNFCKPVLIDDQIVFTTGDAGNAYRMDDGHGYLYALDRKTGELQNFRLFQANTFSTPIFDERHIFITSIDSHLYAIDRKLFLSRPGNLLEKGYHSIRLEETALPTFTDSVKIKYHVDTKSEVVAFLYDLKSNAVKQFLAKTLEPGAHELFWNGENAAGETVPAGYYYFEIKSGAFFQTGYVQKTE